MTPSVRTARVPDVHDERLAPLPHGGAPAASCWRSGTGSEFVQVDDLVGRRRLDRVDLVVRELDGALTVIGRDDADRLGILLVDVERALLRLQRDAVDAVDLLLLALGDLA